MPSTTEPQARFFAACAHGAGYPSCPAAKVSHDFNQADKGSALLSHAMQHRHAAGGAISPLASLVGNPMTMRSSMPHMGQPMGTAGRMRMPHVPLADTMHNIDQHMAGARSLLPKLRAGGRAKGFDDGGEVQPTAPQPAAPQQQGAAPPTPSLTDEQINALLRAAQVQIATDPQAAAQDHGNLQRLLAYMAQRQQLGATTAGPPPQFDDGGRVQGTSSPGSPGFSGAARDALAALKDYLVDRPRRENAAARQAQEDAIASGNYTGPQQQSTSQPQYAAGGQVRVALGEKAKGAVKAALTHIANKDSSSAAATLRASPEAMQHSVVRRAAHALHSAHGIASAIHGLSALSS